MKPTLNEMVAETKQDLQFIEKETQAQLFSCGFRDISRTTFP